jgi:hypothetical protein
MDKYIKDGKVAVLYSPGFGAGWSTWNSDPESLMFDSILVQAVMDENWDEVMRRATEICPDGYFGGVSDLEIAWVPEGEPFDITEYDGSERVVVISRQNYYRA